MNVDGCRLHFRVRTASIVIPQASMLNRFRVDGLGFRGLKFRGLGFTNKSSLLTHQDKTSVFISRGHA